MFSLAMVPCSDAHEDLQDDHATHEPASHDHSQDQGDDCTTFCSCSCCGVQVMVTETPDLIVLAPTELSEQGASSHHDYSRQSPDGIWRPPSRG